MRVEADRLAGMVDDPFELSRIQAGALRLSLATVPLQRVVGDAMAATEPLALGEGVRLVARNETSCPEAAAQLDQAEFGRALRNVLTNAVRHTPSDGTVTVTTWMDEAGDAVLCVAGECGGIAGADVARLFEVGFRGEPARSPDRYAGAGLGLAIAHGIVVAHAGRIEVANAGPGCRFVLRLPGVRTS